MIKYIYEYKNWTDFTWDDKALIEELEVGEKSGFVKDFDRKENLRNIHAKHLNKREI